MWRSEPRAGSGSPGCPDLLQHVQALRSPPSPLYLSFFEEECRAIAARLRLGAAAEPSPGPGELSALQPEPAGPVTSTPLPVPTHERLLHSSAGACEAAAAPAPGPAPSRREPGSLSQPAAGGGPGGRPARPPALPRRARRGAGQPSGGPGRSPGRGRARLAVPRTRASLGLQLPAAGTGRGAWETRLLQPPGSRLKLTSPARARLQRASGASQQTQSSALLKPVPRDREMKTAVKVGSRKQPSSRLSTAIPTVASRSSLRPPGKVVSSKHFCLSKGSTTQDLVCNWTQELVCNRTQELKENGESKERLVAPGTVLGAGKTDQTWVCVESSLSNELAPGLTSRCEDAVPAEQREKEGAKNNCEMVNLAKMAKITSRLSLLCLLSGEGKASDEPMGDQLSQELERVKKELERVKSELADKTAQCEAYQQTISSLQAELRAAGICLKDAAVFDSGDLGRD